MSKSNLVEVGAVWELLSGKSNTGEDDTRVYGRATGKGSVEISFLTYEGYNVALVNFANKESNALSSSREVDNVLTSYQDEIAESELVYFAIKDENDEVDILAIDDSGSFCSRLLSQGGDDDYVAVSVVDPEIDSNYVDLIKLFM